MDRLTIAQVIQGNSANAAGLLVSDSSDVSNSSSEEDESSSESGDDWQPWNVSPPSKTSVETARCTVQALGDGVLAEVPQQHQNVQCKLVELDVLRRNWQLHRMKLRSKEYLASAMYETEGPTSVCMPDDVVISIPIHVPHTCFRPEQTFNCFFYVEQYGVWQSRPAEYKDRTARAHVKVFKSLCVTVRPRTEEHLVTPKGNTFVSSDDTEVTVEFPEGVVHTGTLFRFTVDSIDQKRIRDYQKYNPDLFRCITGFSTVLHVQQEHSTLLHGQVRVTLPVHTAGDDDLEEGLGKEENDVVILRWTEEDVEVIGAQSVRKDGCYSIFIRHFSGYSAVQTRRPASTQDILSAARIIAGRQLLCTLLSFIKIHMFGPVLVVDVVESSRANRAALRLRKEGLREIELSRSRDIPMTDTDRIKIDLGGNLVPVPGVPKAVYNLTFLKSAATNRVTFPLQTRASSSYFSIVTFRGPRGKWVHSIHFCLAPGPCYPKNFLVPTNESRVRPSHFRPEVKYRPVSDIPVTRVVFKNSDDDDFRLDESRPVTCMSAFSGQSLGGELDMESMLFDRPTSRVSCLTSESPVNSTLTSPTPAKHTPHPLLTDRSLQVLSEQLSLAEWTRVMLELTLETSDISRVCEDVGTDGFSPSFKLLVHWRHMDSDRSDRDLVSDMAATFVELSRRDMAEVLRKAGRTYRQLKRSDFKRIK